ncbi:hypothetical protein GALL_487200 [mine drainage metagenome]|uniref:Uncharacterized protein n=1 Tax=mine drainage metagenome TaxID=410659 RepID=A0A1J5PE90_9ZZZZ
MMHADDFGISTPRNGLVQMHVTGTDDSENMLNTQVLQRFCNEVADFYFFDDLSWVHVYKGYLIDIYLRLIDRR